TVYEQEVDGSTQTWVQLLTVYVDTTEQECMLGSGGIAIDETSGVVIIGSPERNVDSELPPGTAHILEPYSTVSAIVTPSVRGAGMSETLYVSLVQSDGTALSVNKDDFAVTLQPAYESG
ncbi:hypothetical protein KIPB_016341, partial [Kipferlia bialata]